MQKKKKEEKRENTPTKTRRNNSRPSTPKVEVHELQEENENNEYIDEIEGEMGFRNESPLASRLYTPDKMLNIMGGGRRQRNSPRQESNRPQPRRQGNDMQQSREEEEEEKINGRYMGATTTPVKHMKRIELTTPRRRGSASTTTSTNSSQEEDEEIEQHTRHRNKNRNTTGTVSTKTGEDMAYSDETPMMLDETHNMETGYLTQMAQEFDKEEEEHKKGGERLEKSSSASAETTDEDNPQNQHQMESSYYISPHVSQKKRTKRKRKVSGKKKRKKKNGTTTAAAVGTPGSTTTPFDSSWVETPPTLDDQEEMHIPTPTSPLLSTTGNKIKKLLPKRIQNIAFVKGQDASAAGPVSAAGPPPPPNRHPLAQQVNAPLPTAPQTNNQQNAASIKKRRQKKRLQKAKRHQVRSKYSKSLSAAENYAIGKQCYEDGHFDNSLVCLKRYILNQLDRYPKDIITDEHQALDQTVLDKLLPHTTVQEIQQVRRKLGESSYMIGQIYRKHCDNARKALKYYRIATSFSNNDACYQLGNIYKRCRHFINAKRYFEMAKDHAGAETNLGIMYHYGQGVDQDYQYATEMFQIAAAKDYPRALECIGVMYFNGQGVRRDFPTALSYYQRAFRLGLVRTSRVITRLKQRILKDTCVCNL